MKWYIDAGHGGTDPGALGQGNTKEAEINLLIALKVGKFLAMSGEYVQYSRTHNTYLTLTDRCKTANSLNADVFLSIHCNSASNKDAYGVECWVYKDDKKALSYELSKLMCDRLAKVNNTKNRGVKVNPKFTVLAKTKMPSIILETDFISNKAIEAQMKTEKYIYNTSKAIAEALLEKVGKKFPIESVCSACGK